MGVPRVDMPVGIPAGFISKVNGVVHHGFLHIAIKYGIDNMTPFGTSLSCAGIGLQ